MAWVQNPCLAPWSKMESRSAYNCAHVLPSFRVKDSFVAISGDSSVEQSEAETLIDCWKKSDNSVLLSDARPSRKRE
jgi:hypothetical protein